jgi:membrane fusion protein (multidrug efflux system)
MPAALARAGATTAAEAPNPAVARNRARVPFLVLGGVVLATAAGIGGYVTLTAGQETTDDAQVEAAIVPLATRVAGVVARVLVKDDAPVKKGDLLLELDGADYAAKVDQATADLEAARAQAAAAEAAERIAEASAKGGLASAKAMVTGSSVAVSGADAQIAVARADVARATSEVHKAAGDLARAKELRGAAAVSGDYLEKAQLAYDTAAAALARASAALTAAEDAKRVALSRVAEAEGRLDVSAPIDAQIAAAKAAADLARARVKSSEAALALATLTLSYTKIYAPGDGVVSKLSVNAGQLLQAGQPFAQLVPAETYVVANFKETQVGEMKPGQRVRIKVDAYGGREFEGVVVSLSGGTGARFSLMPPDNASGNFVKVVQRVPVRIAWKDVPPDVVLRAGMSAEVTVFVGGGP